MMFRSEFVVIERHSLKILLKWHSSPNVARILKMLIPAASVSFLLSVTEAD